MEQAQPASYRRALATTWRLLWPILRQVLGWLFIILGLLGLVLPFLQGVLFLVIGIMLVGPRNWLIRRVNIAMKIILRRWAALETPVIGPVGRCALKAQRQTARQFRGLQRHYRERKHVKTSQQEQ